MGTNWVKKGQQGESAKSGHSSQKASTTVWREHRTRGNKETPEWATYKAQRQDDGGKDGNSDREQ